MLKYKTDNVNKNFYFNLYIKHKNICNKKNIKTLYYETIQEYKSIKEELKNILKEKFNEKNFNNYFLKNHNIILSKKTPMIDNILYNYLLDIDYKITFNKYIKLDFFELIGKFLEIYTCNKNPNEYTLDKLSQIISENCFVEEKSFKKNLILLMHMGNKLIINVNKETNIEQYYTIFNDKLLSIYKDIKITDNIIENIYPKNYNWKIYIKYYTFVLCQKLYLDYKLHNIINKQCLDEIFVYIPNINCAKNIIKFGITAHIINIRYIIAKIFQFNNDYIAINVFLYRNLKNFQINFLDINNELCYYTDGGIICDNIINYNTIQHLLCPYTFYYLLYHKNPLFEENINIILRSLFKILSNVKLINPSLTYNYGTTSLIYNQLIDYYYITQYFGILQDNIYLYALVKNKLNAAHTRNIEYIQSINIVSAKFDNWSIQLKLPSKYIIYYDNTLLNHLILSKIVLFDGIIFDKYRPNLVYPGMIFYKKTLDFVQKPHVITKFTHTYIKEIKHFISFAKICSQELNLIYNELILITPYGIIVGYFNVIKLIDEKLYLCYNSPIYNNYIDAGILYNDTKKNDNCYDILLYNKYNNRYQKILNMDIDSKNKYYTTFGSNILYYNFFYKTPIEIIKFTIDQYEDINIKIRIDSTINIIKLNYIENTVEFKV